VRVYPAIFQVERDYRGCGVPGSNSEIQKPGSHELFLVSWLLNSPVVQSEIATNGRQDEQDLQDESCMSSAGARAPGFFSQPQHDKPGVVEERFPPDFGEGHFHALWNCPNAASR
jgi:hypothetical protein